MKKIISIAVVAAIFGLVGCASSRDKVDSTTERTVTSVSHKKCKSKKCRRGKLGVEQIEKDTTK